MFVGARGGGRGGGSSESSSSSRGGPRNSWGDVAGQSGTVDGQGVGWGIRNRGEGFFWVKS